MDQNVYTSPTVFNYYPADYVIPGTTLAGPQFGIFNATTYFPRANFMYNLSLGASCPAATPNTLRSEQRSRHHGRWARPERRSTTAS